MGDNLPNIKIPVNEWVDLYALSGLTVGTAVRVENVGVCDIYLAVQAGQPPVDHDSYNVLQRGNGVRLQNSDGDTGLWAFCNSLGAKISVGALEGAGCFPSTAVVISTSEGIPVSTQYPLPVDGDSVYAKDVWPEESDATNWIGGVTSPFDNLHTELRNDTTDNPKILLIHFRRTVYANAIGFGSSAGGEFSNLKIEFIGSGGVTRFTFDRSTDNTKRTSYLANIPAEGTLAFNAMRLTFATPDPISITNITIRKEGVSQSTIRGVKPNGETVNIGATLYDNLRVSINEYGDTPAVDAFARLRVSDNYTIFDSKQLHDKQPLFWDELSGGAATSVHNPVNAETRMTVGASAADFVIRQTKQRFNYQPGKSQLAFMTFHSPQQDGVTSRIGLFDGTGANNRTPFNGIFFECDGAVSWNICKNGVITETVTQDQWNVDPLDGTGASEIILDLQGPQILIIDYEWLGVGRVRVGFVIDGLIYYVHYFNHANNPAFDSVYMSTPNLPLRYSIESDGTGGGHLDHICSTVISEGGIEETGILSATDNGITPINGVAAGTIYAVVAIRLKDAYKDITIIPTAMSMISTSNNDFRWSVHINPTLSAALTWAPKTNSAIEEAVGTGQTLTAPGSVVGSGYASKSARGVDQDLKTSQRIGSNIDGTKDILVLAVTPISPNTPVLGSLGYRELL